MPRFARFAWGLLAYDIAVVLWGAYVRATGSGAGCGRHWPLCNGELVPRSPRVETLVELSHRVTSGLALVLTLVLLVWAFRVTPRGHVVRRGATVTTCLMLGEALIGAGLVLFRLVAHDESLARGFSICLHLGNTFLLLASTALTAWWASGGSRLVLRGQRGMLWAMAVPLGALILVGATGAITALGDTLFPPASLAAGLAQDLAAGGHAFVRLRTLHPVLAVSTGAVVILAGGLARALRPSPWVRTFSRAATVLVVAQIAAGLLDVLSLAPVWLQLVHLLLADSVWIAMVLTAASALSTVPEAHAAGGVEPVTSRP
ncbi:MAG TPA: COX15/CtaA family protein [Polyangiaceae bacterium]|jgi:heme A synthase